MGFSYVIWNATELHRVQNLLLKLPHKSFLRNSASWYSGEREREETRHIHWIRETQCVDNFPSVFLPSCRCHLWKMFIHHNKTQFANEYETYTWQTFYSKKGQKSGPALVYAAPSQSILKKWGSGELTEIRKRQNWNDAENKKKLVILLRGSLRLLDERMNYYHDTYSTGG